MSDVAPRLDLPPRGGLGLALDAAMSSFAAAAVRQSGVDPVVTELVRLRCAQYHDCRLCASLRSRDALDRGLDEAAVAKVAQHSTSDLDRVARAALRLADAIIIDPGGIDDELAVELRACFSDEQIAELCLDVVKWSKQKFLVALRLESPPSTGLTVLSFDEQGEPRFDGPVRRLSRAPGRA